MAKAPKPSTVEPDSTADDVEDAVVQEIPDADPPKNDASDSPEPLNSPLPAKRRGAGFFAMLLGGVLAAVIGFVAARYVVPEGWPFPGVAPEVDPLAAIVEENTARLSALQGQADTYGDTIATLQADAQIEELRGEMRGEFGVLQAQLHDLGTRLVALDARLTAVEKMPRGSGTAAAEAAAAAYERELAGMRAMLDGELARIAAAQNDTVSLEENAAAAAKAAAGRAAMARVLAALDTGRPFEDALFDFGEATGIAAPSELASLAAEGAPTLAALQDSFPIAARTSLDASIRAAVEDGSMSRVTAFLRTQLGTRSLEAREGDDPDAILSRAEAALKTGEINAALAELATMPKAGQPALADWLDQAMARMNAVKAGDDLARQLNSN